jgi:hypothetical protein
MIAAGVIAFLSSEQDKPRHLGRVAIGLGLMLLSLRLLTWPTEPCRNSPPFLAVLAGLQDEYVIAVLFGALATWAGPFQPVDRAAGDVVCRQRHRQPGAGARPGDRRQHRRGAGALHRPAGLEPAGAARARWPT